MYLYIQILGKIEILVKIEFFGQKSEILITNQKFRQK